MNIKKITTIFLLITVILFTPFRTFAQTSLDKQRAKLLYNLPIYLRWENDDNIDVIKIGVLKGSPTFIKELKKITKNGYDNIILIDVINFSSVSNISETHLLYIPKAQNALLSKIRSKIAGFNTALITEDYKVKKNIMINMMVRSGTLTFEMNSDNLKDANIKYAPEIKQLGGKVISANALLNESEASLKKEKNKVQGLRKSIGQKQQELEAKEEIIKNKEKEIERQKEVLFNQGDQIIGQRKKIDVQIGKLNKLLQDANIAKHELERQTKNLHEKEHAIRKQEERIGKQTKVLAKLEKGIKEGQKKINRQNIEILQQTIKIKFQQNVLTIFIFLLVIILILTFFLFRGNKIKKRKNILLAEQKAEIETQAAKLEEINKELEKLSIVASESSSAVVIMDSQANFDWVNIGFTKMYGYTLQELLKKFNKNLRKASNYPNIEFLVDKCIKEKEAVIYESSVETLSGNIKWAQSTLSPILNDQGEIHKIVLIDSDITKIKKAENEILRKNEKISLQSEELEKKNIELEKLSLVASKTDNSVVIANANGEIEWVNDGFSRLLGVSFDDFSKEYGTNLFTTSLNPNLPDLIAEAIVYKQSTIYTTKTIKKNGDVLWIQTTMTPIFNKVDEVEKFIAIDANVTKIKLAEEEIAFQKQKMTDSIVYAKKIQTAVLPPEDYLKNHLPEHFIMFRPKDIVSGDFYWASDKGDNLLIAAADCTGHGVPGGFMSMLGMTFLNEITGKLSNNALNAGEILTRLRNSVKLSLRQTGKEGEAKDGMDIAFCIFNKKDYTLQYAGANNPLVIIRSKKEEIEIMDVKADDMPIGIYFQEKASFTNHEIQLQKGDTFYIFSDGYTDQFGGKTGRKFMLNRFKKLLASQADKPLDKQKEKIEHIFDEWKGAHRQIDDILVIGVRV